MKSYNYILENFQNPINYIKEAVDYSPEQIQIDFEDLCDSIRIDHDKLMKLKESLLNSNLNDNTKEKIRELIEYLEAFTL